MGKRKDMDFPVGNQQPSKRAKYDPSMKFYFINVGQGECILIKLPNQEWMLVDFGSIADWSDRSATVIDTIKSLVPKQRLEYLILTHADMDHYNKLSALLDKDEISKPFSIGHLYFSAKGTDNNLLSQYNSKCSVGHTITTGRFADFLHFVNINGDVDKNTKQPDNFVRTYSKADGYKNSTDDRNISELGYLIASDRELSADGEVISVSWEIFIMLGGVRAPNKDSKTGIFKNTASIVTLFKLHDSSDYILLRGDSTDYTDDYLLQRYGDFFDNNTIKLGNIAHHGSPLHCNNSRNVERFAPQTAIVSCQQEHMGYSHPSLDIEDVYGVNQLTENIVTMEGFSFDNTSINNVSYCERVRQSWVAQEIPYVPIYRPKEGKNRKVIGFHSLPPYILDKNQPYMDISVYKNGRIYRKIWSTGDVETTFEQNEVGFRDPLRPIYIEKIFEVDG